LHYIKLTISLVYN